MSRLFRARQDGFDSIQIDNNIGPLDTLDLPLYEVADPIDVLVVALAASGLIRDFTVVSLRQ